MKNERADLSFAKFLCIYALHFQIFYACFFFFFNRRAFCPSFLYFCFMETQPGISLKNRPYLFDCIHWNEDGQLSVCVENGVHIMVNP